MKFILCIMFIGISQICLAADFTGVSSLSGIAGSVYTYPSLSRHDNRYWNNTRLLYEKVQPQEGQGDLECVQDAVDTLSMSMPYYAFYYKRDTKIITDMPNVPSDVGVVVFSSYLTQEAELLPSGGDMSPVLYLSSLLKIMCPLIISRTGYDRHDPKSYYDYLLFKYDRES